MPRSRRHHQTVDVSPLARVTRALARQASLDPVRFHGEARALTELGHLAALTIPAHGVLAPSEDICRDIDRIAERHLRRGQAEQNLRVALDSISRIEHRDAIDVAHVLIVDITERAYYYAGLACGIAFTDRGRR